MRPMSYSQRVTSFLSLGQEVDEVDSCDEECKSDQEVHGEWENDEGHQHTSRVVSNKTNAGQFIGIHPPANEDTKSLNGRDDPGEGVEDG